MRLGDPGRRLHVLLVAAALVLSLCAGRVLQLQAVDAPAYAQRASAELTATRDVPAARGAILDRHGVPLATTVPAVDVVVDQSLVPDPAGLARDLAPLLGLSAWQVQLKVSGERRFSYVAKDVAPDVWRQVAAARLPGISSEPAPRRVYPAGPVAGNVVGFVGSEGKGLAGAEQAFQAALAGTPGRSTYESGGGQREIPLSEQSESTAQDGRSVRLTIDRDIQWYAQQVLAAQVEAVRAASGDLVVMDPRTQQVLALATVPTVDPRRPGAVEADDRGDRAVQEAYEPGSVQKALTAAALLDSGAVTTSSVFTVPDSLLRDGHRIRDHSSHETQRLTFAGIIAQSSNVGTMLAAERMDRARLRDYLSAFGLGAKPGLGLPGESRGYLPAGREWTDLIRDTAAFGQGLSTSVVQIASAYATIANGGVRVAPSIVDGWVDPDGAATDARPGETRRVVSTAAATDTAKALEAVMGPDGTGAKLSIPGYRLAGKTGTAERAFADGRGYGDGYTASFAGFAPADAPRVVVAVSLHKPKRGYYGGAVAGPVWRDVLAFALQKLQVPPTGAKARTLPVFAQR